MEALYSTTLLVEGPRKIPLDPNSLFVGEKIAQVAKAMFWVYRLDPSTYLMYVEGMVNIFHEKYGVSLRRALKIDHSIYKQKHTSQKSIYI